MKTKLYYLSAALILLCCAVITGCSGATGNISAGDPVERGCSYIAAAIVTSAVLRALFNK
jgi:hypothetical protein